MSAGNMAGTTSRYEFSPQENSVIKKTSTGCLTWGVMSIVLGGLTLLGSPAIVEESTPAAVSVAQAWIQLLVQSTVFIVVGFVFVMTARSLKAVVETKGDDIGNMIAAVKKLGVAFIVQIVGFVLTFITTFITEFAA